MRLVALCAMAVMCLAQPAAAQTRVVVGQFGVLGEWDLTGTLTQRSTDLWAGPVRLRHVGYCTVDGPEEKSGDLQLNLAEPRGTIKGNILIDGVACTFSARLKDGYDGALRCPDRRNMPITLSVD